jgi:Flp pilus assembly protein TadD
MKLRSANTDNSLFCCGLALLAVVSFAVLFTGCASEEKYDISPEAVDESEAEYGEGAHKPPSAKTLYSLSRVLAAQGRYKESGFVLARVIAEHPHYLPAYSELAELYIRDSRVDDAVRVLEGGLALVPDDPVLLNNLGMCHMLKQDYEKAAESFEGASKAMPQLPLYRANLAAAKGMAGEYDESFSLYQEVVSTGNAHYNLGVLCEAREDFDRAEEEFKLARKFDYDW